MMDATTNMIMDAYGFSYLAYIYERLIVSIVNKVLAVKEFVIDCSVQIV